MVCSPYCNRTDRQKSGMSCQKQDPWGAIFEKFYDKFTIINMLIFERSYDDFMINLLFFENRAPGNPA